MATEQKNTPKTREPAPKFSICSGVQMDAKKLNSAVGKLSKEHNKSFKKVGLEEPDTLTIFSYKNKVDKNGKVAKAGKKGGIPQVEDKLLYKNIDEVKDDDLRAMIVLTLNKKLAAKTEK